MLKTAYQSAAIAMAAAAGVILFSSRSFTLTLLYVDRESFLEALRTTMYSDQSLISTIPVPPSRLDMFLYPLLPCSLHLAGRWACKFSNVSRNRIHHSDSRAKRGFSPNFRNAFIIHLQPGIDSVRHFDWNQLRLYHSLCPCVRRSTGAKVTRRSHSLLSSFHGAFHSGSSLHHLCSRMRHAGNGHYVL